MVEQKRNERTPLDIPVEILKQIPTTVWKQEDLKAEVSRGALKNVVRNFRRRGYAVGVQMSNVPGKARLLVAEHPALISSAIAAGVAGGALAGGIFVYEKYKERKKERKSK